MQFTNHCFSCDKNSNLGCFETNIDFFGNDLVQEGKEQIASAEACRDECLDEENCTFFTYVKDNSECWLKTSDAGRRATPDHVSGKINCPDPSALNGLF